MPAWAVLYVAMFGATVAGQLGGMLVDALVGRRMLWLPALCSVVLEAIVGARLGRPRGITAGLNLSTRYSLALAALSLPLAVWVAIEKGYGVGFVVVVAVAAIAAATVLRGVLMTAFARGRTAAP